MKAVITLFSLLTFSAFGYPAKVVAIADGDTVTVLTAENQQVKIRLAGASMESTQGLMHK
ncbi:MAG: hypothetical protein WC959_11535 [Kiritimatiellales bacterium]